MAKLELPVRAFVEDFCKRAFPDRNWNRGSGINDLVIKPMAVMLQPLRHELDVTKVGQSITNYLYMRRGDLDALAANWGKFRQRGSKSVGMVRIYFDTAAEYRFTYLEFFSLDGTTFVLVSPVDIGITDLLARRRTDGLFFFDVQVQSIGVGNRYALPAGSIVGIRNAPPGIIRVENIEDFQVTAPDESNYDVVNSMFKNLGMRNLVSRASIRAPILDNFAGILDLFIAGPEHPKMVRDLLDVEIDGKETLIHVGGMADVWLNTTSIIQRTISLSYLPSSGKFRIVSQEQAQENELLFNFATSLLTLDGRFSAPDYPDAQMDESSGVLFDVAGVVNNTFALAARQSDGMFQLGTKDVVGGSDMMALPTPNNDDVVPATIPPSQYKQSIYLADLIGINLANTDAQVGDILFFQGVYRKITALGGRVLSLGPSLSLTSSFIWSDNGGRIVMHAGDRFIPTSVGLARINDECLIPFGPAAGQYRVLSVDPVPGSPTISGISVGNVVSRGSLVYQSNQGGEFTYLYYAPPPAAPLTAPKLPLTVSATSWVHLADDEGYDQTPATWLRIKSVTRLPSNVVQIVTIGGTTTPPAVVTVVEGLRDVLLTKTAIFFERTGSASFNRSTRQIFGDPAALVGNEGHTLYANQVQTLIVAATTTLQSLGIGVIATVGDLIIFEGGNIPENQRTITGGDGTKFTVMIDSIVDDDTIVFRPGLPFDIQPGTRLAVLRNHVPVGSAVVDAIDVIDKTVEFVSWPLGLGDGTGMFLRDPSGQYYTIMRSTAGLIRQLKFNPDQQAVTLTFGPSGYLTAGPDDIGSAVQQDNGIRIVVGVLKAYDNAARTWDVIPNDPAVDVFVVSPTNPVTIVDSPATGFVTGISAPFQVNYFAPVMPADKGMLVRQGDYIGVLDDVNGYTWTIKPLSESDLFDSVDDTTFVDYGTGVPQFLPGKGYGTLREPASPPVLNQGTAIMVLDDVPAFVPTDTLQVFSRFGISGGMFDGRVFKVLPDAAVNLNPFGTVDKATDKLLALLGSNYDTYDLDNTTRWSLGLSDVVDADLIRIANAPGPMPLPIVGAIYQGTTALNVVGSNMGIWAQHGRILVISTGGAQYNLIIDHPLGIDSVQLLDPLPITLYPDEGGIEYEIVEGLNTPFMVVPQANLLPYRVFRTPQLADVLVQGISGNYGSAPPNNNLLIDPAMNFASLISGSDYTTGDLLLYIDSGPDASPTPRIITGLFNAITLSVSPVFTNDATNIQYHVSRRNYDNNHEFWVNGTITGANTIHLDVPVGWDIARNFTDGELEFVIAPHPHGSRALETWSMPIVTGTYDPVAQVLTLNMANGTVDPGHTIFLPTIGFPAPYIGQEVRVMPRLTDRSATHNLSGSAVNTFDYYAGTYFALPVVRIQSVDQLNPQTGVAEKSLAYRMIINFPGLRYSANENDSIEILDPDKEGALLQPIRVTYLADLSVSAINAYLNADDTRVLNANQLAKRMETISVDLAVSVRSELTEAQVSDALSTFINTTHSVERLSKDKLIKYLYDHNVVSYIEVASITLSGTYYPLDGVNVDYTDVDELFGADTACYLARSITVTKLTERVTT